MTCRSLLILPLYCMGNKVHHIAAWVFIVSLTDPLYANPFWNPINIGDRKSRKCTEYVYKNLGTSWLTAKDWNKSARFRYKDKGPFTYYVSQILAILDPLRKPLRHMWTISKSLLLIIWSKFRHHALHRPSFAEEGSRIWNCLPQYIRSYMLQLPVEPPVWGYKTCKIF